MEIEIYLLLFAAAFVCELIDSALGMGYGTILSPGLIALGFPVMFVVPAILFTQALGGAVASIFHHAHGNAVFGLKSKNPVYIVKNVKEHGLLKSFKKGVSEDLKVVCVITSLGVIATVISAFIAVSISKTALTTYISILVVLMGLLIISGITFRYSTTKMFIVGVVSSFNKGLSGGGFGPVVTGSQMVLGQDNRKAIACTTASEPLICITGFISYMILKGISGWDIIAVLGVGSVLAGAMGPWATKNINKRILKVIVALIMVLLGAVVLLKTYNLLDIGVSVSM